jgi:hypothetical protein
MFSFALDDPTRETIKKGKKNTMCQKCETDTPYVTPRPNMMHYVEGQWGTWRNTNMKTTQHQRYFEEVEMRTWSNEDSNRIHQDSSL